MKSTGLDILIDHTDYVAINKPAGIAVIPGRAETTCVIAQLAQQLRLPWQGTQSHRLRIVHRIDKDTSGVLLMAKHTNAQRHLSHQFQNNAIGKEYLAIVAGLFADDSGEIDARLAPHPTDKTRMNVFKHGRPALTRWQVEARYRMHSLVRCFPQTGKTHQIRVHLAYIGHPLAVDPLYNSDAPPMLLSILKRNYQQAGSRQEKPLISRLTLHAHRLRFLDLANQPVQLEAELPKDFRATLNQLGKSSGR